MDTNHQPSIARTALVVSRLPTRPVAASGPATGFVTDSKIWQRAVNAVNNTDEWRRYCKILSADGASLDTTSTDTARIIAAAADRILTLAEKAKSSRTKVFREVYDKVTTFLSVFKDLGTAASAFNPYAAFAWTGLQFFVAVAVNHRDIRDMCLEGLPRITYLIGRYQTFEEVYSLPKGTMRSQDDFERALEGLFVSMLKFQIAVVNYAASRTDRLKAMFKGKLSSPPQVLLNDIKRNEEDLDRLQTLINREIDNARYDELSGVSAELRASLGGVKTLSQGSSVQIQAVAEYNDVERRSEILNWISPIPYEDAHNQSKRIPLESTGDWLVKDPRYREWIDNAESSTLWLHGFMGSGKSCLTHTVIEDIVESMSHANKSDSRLAYFYCDGTDAPSEVNEVNSILGSFVKQLADLDNKHGIMKCVSDVYEGKRNRSSHTTIVQNLKFINQLIDSIGETIFVIDGVDECPTSTQRDLLNHLEQIKRKATWTTVKIFVSSRNTPLIADYLNQDELKAVLIDAATKNGDDIKTMIIDEVKKALKAYDTRRLYKTGNGDQSEDVISTLERYAGGMFRWVTVALDHLHASLNFHEMSLRLVQLSKYGGTLFKLYDVVYEAALNSGADAGETRRETLIVALRFLLYEGENNCPQYLSEACTFAITQKLRSDFYELRDIVALCPSFIAFAADSDSECKLVIPHFSVKEYLVQRYGDDFSSAISNRYLARLCIEVLIKDEVTETCFSWYAAVYWVVHLMRQGSGVVPGKGTSMEQLIGDDDLLKRSLVTFLAENATNKGLTGWGCCLNKFRTSGKNSISPYDFTRISCTLESAGFPAGIRQWANAVAEELSSTSLTPSKAPKTKHGIIERMNNHLTFRALELASRNVQSAIKGGSIRLRPT